jgi:hypothetical protein
MNFFSLREKLKKFPKYPGTVQVESAPIINEGYPSNLNLSFAYFEWTKNIKQKTPSKQYVSFAGDMFYTKCQPCIRPQDWKKIVENNQDKYRYLSYFHMADVSGLIARLDSKYRKEIGIFTINSLLNFFKELDLNIKNVYVSYCSGGEVINLTAQKYVFNKNIEPDPFYSDWLKLGILEENMIPDKTRDTLLSLRNYYRPSPWGYRNEIFYKHEGKLLDIATVEHLCFEPVFDDKMNIININDYRHAFSVSGVGIERLLMVMNDFNDVRSVDIIFPLYNFIEDNIKGIAAEDADVIIQTLRPIQALIADGGYWKNLNSRRKEIARDFYVELANIFCKYDLKLNNRVLRDLLIINADLLKNERYKIAVPEIIRELEERITSLVDNKHLSKEIRENYRKLLYIKI